MDFRLSDQQRLLVTIARDFLDKQASTAVAPAGMPHERGLPADVWREMARLGWPGLLVPQALGGSGGSMLDVVLLVEEMGRACLGGPYVGSAVAATALLLRGDPRARQWLPAMALGERIVTLAVAEEGASFAPDSLAMAVDAPGRLEGVKLFVRDADVADTLIVAGRGAGGLNVALVPRDRAGVTVTAVALMSGENVFAVEFRNVAIDTSDLVGSPGRGLDLLRAALRAGALARAAEMVGAAQRVLELAVEHAKVRVQSGRPIGTFQAIQHACADLLRNVEGARWIVRSAAWNADCPDAGGADSRAADTAVATAKAWTGEACLAVARRAHQVFGAIGYCEEHPLHRFHKQILASSVDFGDASTHLETVAGAIGLAPDAV
ncbi:MAG: acyl-CoA/acyl-ACP dehydrogenase [Candidatus Rokubacteria bacterium]|nr:acyl-CoA/acyl-ACP dehydrogenase [Candidatus Rokubacteria bacterium]